MHVVDYYDDQELCSTFYGHDDLRIIAWIALKQVTCYGRFYVENSSVKMVKQLA